jgi:hypothetical protein
VGQQIENLQNSLQENSVSSNSISVYTDQQFTVKTELDCVRQLKNAFPSLPIGFYDILHDRIVDNGFSEQRLKDAVKNLIDTCVYPTPTIANIISWDKRVKLYSYNEMTDLVMKYGASTWNEYGKREVNDKVFWINKAEALQYGIDI